MWYFFDESGNWQEKENKRLVIGGVVVKDKKDLSFINEKVDMFKLERGLKEIHANEMGNIDKEQFLRLILELLEQETFKTYLYIINPDILIKTKENPDEIYSDIASDLLSEISFGDKDIRVEYDMKFHYAYPVKILDNLENKVSSDVFNIMKKNFYLNENAFLKQKNRIKRLILSNKNNINNLNEILYSLGNRRFIFNYLWEEFRLKVEDSLIIREKFKEKAKTKLKNLYEDFELDSKDLNIEIDYKGKYNQSAGVQIIDFLTNIVRHHGKNPKYFNPDVVKDIYKFIDIKEKDA